jgi:predicted HAD superfamily Cof-like phosphohydrolase
MKNNHLEQIKDFMILGSQKISNDIDISDENLNNLRYKLMLEELEELKLALQQHDKTESLDALIDIYYVLLGAILSFGFQSIFEREFLNVHDNNMTKFSESNSEAVKSQQFYKEKGIKVNIFEVVVNEKTYFIIKDEAGKIKKPYNYQPVKLNLNENN